MRLNNFLDNQTLTYLKHICTGTLYVPEFSEIFFLNMETTSIMVILIGCEINQKQRSIMCQLNLYLEFVLSTKNLCL